MACALTRPDWIKSRYNSEDVMEMHRLMSKLSLNTICTEALCPNMGECCKNRTATFLILGNVCTRNCGFCAVRKGKGARLDSEEPQKVAEAARTLRLKHVVITSVTRDDLPDGGAAHFAATIRSIKATSPASTVEALIPDMRGLKENLDMVVAAGPDVVNHNIETVPSLYANVRPEADYGRSLRVLRYVKERAPQILSKTGVMVGLGETPDEIYRVMDDLIAV
ncbi:MAG: lipoyl synthase, partial [Clostridiales Family XIII bacterium]|nr:lipoyl synthase [Clostridiales Family XIII bacterium]